MRSDVVAYAPDLMDSTRVRSALPGATFVRDVAALRAAAGDAGLVLVDLGRPGALEAVAAAARGGARVVGFAAHVDDELLVAARAAGVDALARSVFFRRLPTLAGHDSA